MQVEASLQLSLYSYATAMNGLANQEDLRLRFDVLTKTKQPELYHYWTQRDRAPTSGSSGWRPRCCTRSRPACSTRIQRHLATRNHDTISGSAASTHWNVIGGWPGSSLSTSPRSG